MKIILPLIGFIFSIQAYAQNTSFVRLMLNDSSDHAHEKITLASFKMYEL